ncbi:hypothetical protein L6R50_14315 [Myxococcota bacterium]|nr:hypothetical protein [Myxococcota bacterium]
MTPRIVGLAASLLLAPALVSAETIEVGGGGIPTILQAVQIASPGDEILVHPGTYVEALTLREQVTLRSSEGPGETVLAPPHGSSAIAVHASAAGTTIEGFTVRGASAGFGGAVAISGADVTLRGCVFEDNRASQVGGAVYVEAPGARIEDCSFQGNHAERGGGLGAHADVEIAASTFRDNTADVYGGGVAGAEGAHLVVLDSLFEGNSTEESGGGLALLEATGAIAGSTFERNESLMTGGGMVLTSAWAIVAGNTFVANTCSQSGTAIATYVGTTFVVGNDIHDNVGVDGLPAVYYQNTSTGTARNNVFRENTAGGTGGGTLVVELSDVVIANNVFAANESQRGGGAVLVGSYFPDPARPSRGRIENNTFVENVASSGSAVLFSNGEGLVRNNVAAWNASNAFGISDPTLPHAFVYNLTWQNDEAWDPNLGFDAEQGHNFEADPRFVAYSHDGDFTNDDLHLASGSPGVDAGDPETLDADGSRADVGAYGGTWGDAWGDDPLDDGDGDGLSDVEGDCDDAHASAFPGGVEECDGIDNDCDGLVDEDLECGEPPWGDDDTGDDDSADDDSAGPGPGEVGCEGCSAAAASATPGGAALFPAALVSWAARRRRRPA